MPIPSCRLDLDARTNDIRDISTALNAEWWPAAESIWDGRNVGLTADWGICADFQSCFSPEEGKWHQP
jgi:hypothetical protein